MMYYLILVKFQTWDQKIKVMIEKKSYLMLIWLILRQKVFTEIKVCQKLVDTFFILLESFKKKKVRNMHGPQVAQFCWERMRGQK